MTVGEADTTQTMTSFEFSLNRSQFSTALDLSLIALDPEVQQHSASPEQYPPALTPDQFRAQYMVRSDNGTLLPEQELKLRDRIQERLVKWSSEGFFEIVPLPENTRENIGFRITSAGAKAALKAIKEKREQTSDFLSDVASRLPKVALPE